jgi:hypothetical protein
MVPEGSLPHPQKLSTGLCPEQDQFSPQQPCLSLQDPSQYYRPTYVLISLVVYFRLAFSLITFTRSSSCYISRSFQPPCSSFYSYLAKRTNHEDPRYAVFSTLQSPPPSPVQILMQGPNQKYRTGSPKTCGPLPLFWTLDVECTQRQDAGRRVQTAWGMIILLS